MGERGQAAEPFRASQTQRGSLDSTQRSVDAIYDQLNRLGERHNRLEKRLRNVEYWFTNNDWRQAQLRTVNAAQATLAQYAMVDGRVWLMESVVAARRDTGADRAFYHIEGLFYREGAAAAQQGATVFIANIESDATWACTYDVNGINVRIRVTGAAMNIDWRSWTRFREHVAL